jgi:hypothetical protein
MVPFFQMLLTSGAFCNELKKMSTIGNFREIIAKYHSAPLRLHGRSHFTIIDTQREKGRRDGEEGFLPEFLAAPRAFNLGKCRQKARKDSSRCDDGSSCALFSDRSSVARLVTAGQYVSCLY